MTTVMLTQFSFEVVANQLKTQSLADFLMFLADSDEKENQLSYVCDGYIMSALCNEAKRPQAKA